MNAFLAFRVPSGQHSLRFRYYPEGLLLGIFVSALSLLALFIFWRFERDYEQRFQRKVTRRYEALYQEMQEASLRMRAESLSAQQTAAGQPADNMRVEAAAVTAAVSPEMTEMSATESAEERREEDVQIVNLEEL